MELGVRELIHAETLTGFILLSLTRRTKHNKTRKESIPLTKSFDLELPAPSAVSTKTALIYNSIYPLIK